MSIDRIYYLLTNIEKKNEDNIECPDFMHLDKMYINKVAKNVSSLICNQNPDKIECIILIRNLCKQFVGHSSINALNYGAFLNALDISNEPVDTKFLEGSDILVKRNCYQEVVTFYTDKLSRNLQKQENVDLITDMTINSMKTLEFVSSKKLENHTKNKVLAVSFLDVGESEILGSNKRENSSHNKNELREATIKLGYALSNINAPQKHEVFKHIIQDLDNCSTLLHYEMEFIKYLCFQEGFQTYILEKFPFLIEQPLIELCEVLLKCPFVDFAKDNRIDFLQNVLQKNNKIKNKAVDVCYELLALSNYNKKIIKLILYIEKFL